MGVTSRSLFLPERDQRKGCAAISRRKTFLRTEMSSRRWKEGG